MFQLLEHIKTEIEKIKDAKISQKKIKSQDKQEKLELYDQLQVLEG